MLNIDKTKIIDYMNEQKAIIDSINADCQVEKNDNLLNMLNLHYAKLNTICTILNINGYTAEYINGSYIIY